MNATAPNRNPTPPAQARDEALLGVFAPSLYADHVKVYPRSVSGLFRRLKWGILFACLTIYYGLPWLRWDRGPGAPDQALLLDMSAPRAYLFSLEIWPQEIYYITGLLILGAIALFLATALFGRVWCGYACPQTVWTDLFLAVERWIEGDRNARMRLDAQPMSMGRATRNTVKHGLWLLVSAATGGAWIMYFQDAPSVTRALLTGAASSATYFFFGLFTLTTYVLAGWAREQVCTYMCPWPRFQAAMQDEHSLVVSYQDWRGETRGKHKAGESWEGRGDCIDCHACVHVCPTGIDIRNGPQLECIGCALCIDACDDMMVKVGRPVRLIDFVSLDNMQRRALKLPDMFRLVRLRTALYAALLLLVGAVMTAVLLGRSEVVMTVQQDRAPLHVMLSDGGIRNGYSVKMTNRTHQTLDLEISVEGLGTAELFQAGMPGRHRVLELSVRHNSSATHHIFVAKPRQGGSDEMRKFVFVLRDHSGKEFARTHTQFSEPM